MKYDKFSAFPKTDVQKKETNNLGNILPLLKNLLPALTQKSRAADTKAPEKPETAPYIRTPNAEAYSDYVARHNAHVAKSKAVPTKDSPTEK